MVTRHYLLQHPNIWPFVVLTGFPFREMVMYRPEQRPKPVEPPKDPNASHAVTGTHSGPRSLYGHDLHVFWMNLGILALAAGIGVSFLKGKWLAGTHLTAVAGHARGARGEIGKGLPF